MTLKDFLQICSKDDYIGIWDVSVSPDKKNKSNKRFEICPKEQNYFKIGNIPYGRIMNYLDRDVMSIFHTEKGFVVRIYHKEELHKNIDTRKLASEIAKRMEGKGWSD